MALQPGDRFGRYELVSWLGRGGMAETWRARLVGDAGVTKPVLIKKVLPEYATDEAFISMFISEARISATLSHGNVAQVYDFGRVDGEYFLAMEFVDGQPLDRILKRALKSGLTALPIPLATFIALEMCRGLHYAHTRTDAKGALLGLVHRDISPDNVLISYEGQVKIVDFGIAKARSLRSFNTAPGVVKGKYLFFSPEQARGKDVDARTDVWATGVVLYELLCGQMPVVGPAHAVMLRMAHGEFPSPRQVRKELPAELEEIVMRALSVDLGLRFESSHAFADALSGFLYSFAPRFSSMNLAHLVRELFRGDLVQEGRELSVPPSFREELELWRGSGGGSATTLPEMPRVAPVEPPSGQASLPARKSTPAPARRAAKPEPSRLPPPRLRKAAKAEPSAPPHRPVKAEPPPRAALSEPPTVPQRAVKAEPLLLPPMEPETVPSASQRLEPEVAFIAERRRWLVPVGGTVLLLLCAAILWFPWLIAPEMHDPSPLRPLPGGDWAPPEAKAAGASGKPQAAQGEDEPSPDVATPPSAEVERLVAEARKAAKDSPQKVVLLTGRCLELAPDYPDCLALSASAKARLGNIEEGMKEYRRYLKVLEQPRMPADEALAPMKVERAMEQRVSQASTVPTAAAVPMQAEADRLVTEARTLLKSSDRGSFKKALALTARCLQLIPDHPNCVLLSGVAYARLGDIDTAAERYRRFLELAPGDHPSVPGVRMLLERYDQSRKP